MKGGGMWRGRVGDEQFRTKVNKTEHFYSFGHFRTVPDTLDRSRHNWTLLDRTGHFLWGKARRGTEARKGKWNTSEHHGTGFEPTGQVRGMEGKSGNWERCLQFKSVSFRHFVASVAFVRNLLEIEGKGKERQGDAAMSGVWSGSCIVYRDSSDCRDEDDSPRRTRRAEKNWREHTGGE